jgi:hypothetical protein
LGSSHPDPDRDPDPTTTSKDPNTRPRHQSQTWEPVPVLEISQFQPTPNPLGDYLKKAPSSLFFNLQIIPPVPAWRNNLNLNLSFWKTLVLKQA